MKQQLRGVGAAWGGRLIIPFVMATPHTHRGAASPQACSSAPVAARCWYVVPETVVPVNLNDVAVVSSRVHDASLRRVTFLQTARPMKVVTELVVDPLRLDEVLESVAQRRNECAARLWP
jgi:hypothetical protein